jgi:uncharacterized repeat protein (TIGR04052 family)
MMTTQHLSTAIVIALGALAITPIPGHSEAAETVTIQFAGTVGDQPFDCRDTYELGTTNTPVMATDFRLYVSEVALIDVNGNAVPLELQQDGRWQYQNVALLDFEDRTGACANGTTATRNTVVGTVPAGDYRGLRFTLGVPFALNHEDATLAPSPLNLTALWWNWQGGYKFMRVDLEHHAMAADIPQPDAKGVGHHQPGDHSGHGSQAAAGMAFHIGSTGCQIEGGQQPTSCSHPNRPEVIFDSFNPDQDVVLVDLAALLQDNNLMENAPDTPTGCMSSPGDGDCSGVMGNLGLPFGQAPATEQTVFRTE